MNKSSVIYIAGHKGLVGTALSRKLSADGYSNIITQSHSKLDLTSQKEVENFFKKEKPQYVFLAAAKVGGILANDIYKADFIYDNIMIAANVIHAAYRYGVNKLLNLGSSCIYPKLASQPIKEDYLLTGYLEPTNEPYAIAKISAIKLCKYFNEQYKTNFISVMPTNLYGPNDNFNLETAHVLQALIRKFHLAKLLKNANFKNIKKDILRYQLGFKMNSKAIIKKSKNSIRNTLKKLGITQDYVVIWGAGKAYREFLYVDDLADACMFLMQNYNYKDIGEFVNIGVGEDIRINDVAKIIKEIVGYDGEIKHDLSKPDGTPRKLLDISKIKSLEWKPTISLKKGIEMTYDWYVKLIQQQRLV